MTTEDLKAQEGHLPEIDTEGTTGTHEDSDGSPESDPLPGDDGSAAAAADQEMEAPETDSASGTDPEEDLTLEEDPTVEEQGHESGAGSDSDLDLLDGIDSDGGEEGEMEIGEIQDELRRLRDQHLRLAADFENYRKRAGADLAGVWTRARADLVKALVEGLDDLQRVSRFTSEDTTVEALIEGVDLVERNLLKALTEAGLEVLSPEGERFDPNSMEAMMRVPTEEDGQDETVHQVFQKGYMFKEQLVRPARVSVYMDED